MGSAQSEWLAIADLAAASGVSAKTIRFYEARGVLPPPRRSTAGYRLYTKRDAERVRFVQALQSSGLSLREITEMVLAPECQWQTPTAIEALDWARSRVRERIAVATNSWHCSTTRRRLGSACLGAGDDIVRRTT